MHIDELPQAVKDIMSAQPLNNLPHRRSEAMAEQSAKETEVAFIAAALACSQQTLNRPADGFAVREAAEWVQTMKDFAAIPRETIPSE